MKLLELVPFLTEKKTLDALYQQEMLDRESEAMLVYMKDNLGIESDLRFLRVEDTDDEIFLIINGERLVQFFPLDYLCELTHSDLNLVNTGYSDSEIAKRLIDYRLNDA